jgi:quinol monooxygenase YgiN
LSAVIIAAVIRVNEGKGDEFEREFLVLQPKVLRDPGAIMYSLHRAADYPCKFFFYEKYASDEAVKYHTSTNHFKGFFQKMGPIMKGKPEISFYKEVNQ